MEIKPFFKNIDSFGIIVHNLDRTIKTYYKKYSIGGWQIGELNCAVGKSMSVGGAKRNYKIKIDNKDMGYAFTIAMNTLDEVEIELIKAHDNKSIYAKYLKKYGEGLQHIGFDTDDFKQTDSTLVEKMGIRVTQEDDWCGANFKYYSTEDDLKFTAELFGLIPKYQKRKADFTYP